MAAALGWSGSEWNSLYALWMQESGFNDHATNPSSGAYGIPQSLPASKMASAGSDWQTNPATQIKWGLSYIKGRYGDPNGAWAHEKKYNWYDKGAWRIEKDETAVVHRDEMILPAKQAETVRAAILRENSTFGAKTGGSGNGVTLMFAKGAINVHLATGDRASAKQAAKQIVDAMVADNRVKKMQVGQ